MSIWLSLSTFALRQVVGGACKTIGFRAGGEATDAVVGFLTERFSDHSQRLTAALNHANERAWKALEISLAGESLWERFTVASSRAEDQAFRQQIRAFLDAASLTNLAGREDFRQQCLGELRAARDGGMLTSGSLDPGQLARQAGAFARFADPASLLDAERRLLVGVAIEFRDAGYSNLAWLLSQQPKQGLPILVASARYFFRRAVENDAKLFQGLTFAQMERLGEVQEEGFAALSAALAQRGQRLEEMLGNVQSVVVETHGAVLDLQAQMSGQGEQIQQMGQAVIELLEQHRLQHRVLRPADSLSIRNDNERQLVRQLVARYRALPERDRKQVPALLNAVGKLEVVAGDFGAAQKDFQAVAELVENAKVQAEAHFNAYRAALELRDWRQAVRELVLAVQGDAKRFMPFPMGKYLPQRILGAGGFGVAFLCKHKYMDAQVVVKTLVLEDLGRDVDKVFAEAHVLRTMDHPAVIRISDCGYADSTTKSQPFIVMDYFNGTTLEGEVKKHGSLSIEDVLAVARPVAEGLEAAHSKGILHRDVKPANLLVRKEEGQWRVKVIDFGLALRQKVVRQSMNASTNKRNKTLIGGSIAGTMDYAAPEQMGKREDAVAPCSDIFGWAKTCCYALFQTTQPLLSHWQSLPLPLAQLLERCLAEDPANRPQRFAEVLAALDAGERTSSQVLLPLTPSLVRGLDARREAVEKPRPRSRAAENKRPRSRVPLLLTAVAVAAVAALVLTVGPRFKTKAGTLVVDVDQPGADVYVDGQRCDARRAGDAEQIMVEVQDGARQLKVVKDGFETFTREFDVKPGDKETISVRLKPITVSARLTNAKPEVPSTAGVNDRPAVRQQSAKVVELPGEVRRFEGHTRDIFCVAFSPDARYALSGGYDFSLRLWDVERGVEIRQFTPAQSYTGASFSPSGSSALSSNWDGSVRLWNVDSGREIRCLQNPIVPMCWGVATSPDGRRALSGSKNSLMRLWDVDSGRELRQFGGHKWSVNCVAFSHDGTRAVSGSGGRYFKEKCDDFSIRVFDVDGGQIINHFSGHTQDVNSVVFLPGDQQILSASDDQTLRLWSLQTGEEIRRFEGHTEGICQVGITQDGKYAVSGSEDKTVRVWHLSTGKEVKCFEGHTGGVRAIAVSPVGPFALSGSRDMTLRLWRLPIADNKHDDQPARAVAPPSLPGGPSPKKVEPTPILERLAGTVWVNSKGVRFEWLADGKFRHKDKERPCRDVGPNEVEIHFGGQHRDRLQFDPALTRFDQYSSTAGGGLLFTGRRLPSGETAPEPVEPKPALPPIQARKMRSNVLSGHTKYVWSVAFSPDGRRLVSGSDDGSVIVWDVESETLIWNRKLDGIVRAVAFTLDAKQVLVYRLRGLVVLDAGTGSVLREVGLESDGWGVFSPNGKYLCVAHAEDGVGRIYSVPDGGILVRNDQKWSMSPTAFTFDRTSRLLYCGRIEVFRLDVSSRKATKTGLRQTSIFQSMDLSRDGKLLATGSGRHWNGTSDDQGDQAVKIWDISARRLVATLNAHGGWLHAVCFTPDAQRLLSGGSGRVNDWYGHEADADNSLRVWNCRLGKQVAKLEGHRAAVLAIRCSPDGRYAATASADTTVRLWRLSELDGGE
jgi:WD40 repeat protein